MPTDTSVQSKAEETTSFPAPYNLKGILDYFSNKIIHLKHFKNMQETVWQRFKNFPHFFRYFVYMLLCNFPRSLTKTNGGKFKKVLSPFSYISCALKGDVKAFIYDASVFLSVIVILEIENVGDPLEWSLIDSYS